MNGEEKREEKLQDLYIASKQSSSFSSLQIWTEGVTQSSSSSSLQITTHKDLLR